MRRSGILSTSRGLERTDASEWGTKLGFAAGWRWLALAAGGGGADRRMSWNSSASSAPGFRRASGRGKQRSWSPVAYRQGPMAYEPPVYCDCKCEPRRKAPRWISWSRQNPDRRYYACPDALVSVLLCSASLPCSTSFRNRPVMLNVLCCMQLIAWWMWVCAMA